MDLTTLSRDPSTCYQVRGNPPTTLKWLSQSFHSGDTDLNE
jgi:hypothetical protein